MKELLKKIDEVINIMKTVVKRSDLNEKLKCMRKNIMDLNPLYCH